jgi:sugar transferase (PEP-CTERM system associated)
MVRIFNQDVSLKALLLVLVETVLMAAALLFGAKLRFWNDPDSFGLFTQLPEFAWQALLFVLVFQTCFFYGDLYNLNAVGRVERWIFLGQALGSGCMVLGVLYFAVPGLLIGRGVFFIGTALLILFVVADRLVLDGIWHMAAPSQNVLILGTGSLAQTIAREFARRADLNVSVVGFLNTSCASGPERLCGLDVFSGSDALLDLAGRQDVSRIVVALEDRRGALPVRDLVRLRVQGVTVEDAQTTIAALSGRVWLNTVRPSWFVFSDGFHRSRWTVILKRAVDLAFGLMGLIVSLPVMALVAIAIKLDSRGPVIYRQTRVGLKGKPFELFKFRSMRTDAEKHNGAQWALEDDPRVTRLGRYLRKFRFDELPQFLNVIRGDMSFVGPRPERPVFVDELRKVIAYYDERHSVRPGITGWAQVQYRYGASVEDAFRKLEYDLFYLKNMSILFDCAIVLKTLRTVMTAAGGR